MEQRTQVLHLRELSPRMVLLTLSLLDDECMYYWQVCLASMYLLEIIGSLRLRLKKDKTFTSWAHDSND